MTEKEGETATVEATFSFVDIAGFTALTETHGARAAADLIDRFGELVEAALGGEGTLVDRAGDAVLVVAPRPAIALGFVTRVLASAAEEPGFPVLRAGLHHGEALLRGGRYFGSAVNLAARVASRAGGDEVLATRIVADEARRLGIPVTRLGSERLRNVREPVDLFALQVHPGSKADSIDPVCRMRVDRDAAAGRLRYEETDYWFCSLDCVRRFAEDPGAYLQAAER